MRIISGQWRGRKIAEPQGRDVTRPTTDRVREAMASMVDSSLPQGIEGAPGARCLCGIRRIGNRDALARCCFAAFLTSIVLPQLSCAKILSRSVFRVPRIAYFAPIVLLRQRGRIEGAPFDLVMVDAPYALGADPATQLAESLVKSGLLASGRSCSRRACCCGRRAATGWLYCRAREALRLYRRRSFAF